MENRHNIGIIGGGICGLYLAWKFARLGEKVEVFERKKEIGNEVCSGLFSERILNFLPQSHKLVKNEINSAVIHFPKKDINVRFSKRFFVMSHFELDRLVASLAREAGAEIYLNRNIEELPQGFEKLIGCDGANSVLRRKLNLPNPAFRLGIHGFVKKRTTDSFVDVWPCKDGFIWKIPRGNEIEYGAIAKPETAKKLLNDFLTKNNISLGNINSKIIPQGLVIPDNQSITLCGDAAGLTKPWSGGGVVWSLIAAEILLKTFPDFSDYRARMKRFFLPKIIFSKSATKLIYFSGFKTPWLLPNSAKIEGDFLL